MAETPLTRRERQARQTQDEILQAARILFAERGYTRTTVRDIAESAAVSAQTVYDSIGSKQALVARLNDLIDQEAEIPRIVGESMASRDPVVMAGTAARVTRSILEHCADILRAMVSGAAAETELAAAFADGHRRHVAGIRRVVAVLHDAGALGSSVDPEEAAETMAALADPTFALLLRDTYGWSLDRIESWIADTTRALILEQ